MTVEEIDAKIAELEARKQQLLAEAQTMLGKILGKIELLEEMKAAPKTENESTI